MSIRFKHLTALLTILTLLLFGQQVAAGQCDCNPCQDICGEWEIGAHALYFTPIACPYAYASQSTTVVMVDSAEINGRAYVVPCRADWGFRLFGNYQKDCFFAGLSYQWFDVTTTRSITANDLHTQGGAPSGAGKATGQVAIEYQNVDIRVGKHVLRSCDSTVYLYGNARWLNLSHRRMTRAIFTNGQFNDLQEKSKLEGGAVGIGFGGEYDVWCDLGAFIDCNVLGVIGRRSLKNVRHRNRFLGNLDDNREAYPSETCVIPEANFRIGLNYAYACGCWRLEGEIGYELDYFWHGSVFPDLVSLAISSGPRQFAPACEDLGFSGLFFGGRLIF